MADNIAVTVGSGTSVATDDISSVHYQRVKLSLGADGTAVDAVAGAGAVSTAVQRVTLASDDPAVTILTAIATYIDTEIAAILAKQPALGTAGTASANVITVQGIASGTTMSTTPAAGELHLGEVGGNTALIAVTFTLDTSIYASGDVLAIPTVLTAALRKNDGTGILQSITLNDEDDQGVALYVVIMDANNSLGTINAAASITDANARNIIAIVPVETTDWIDLGGVRVASIRNLGIPVKALSGAATLYVGLVTRGTPTHTASGITGRFGILRD